MAPPPPLEEGAGLASCRLAEKFSFKIIKIARPPHFFQKKEKQFFLLGSARLRAGGGASLTARGQKISSPETPPFFARSPEKSDGLGKKTLATNKLVVRVKKKGLRDLVITQPPLERI
ncbi:MAG: hypothetical protein DDT19_01111 [Syntrophomonadaceae bacterium]|nr:hypothetical protein [Bacillota bacterium]